LWTLGLGPHVSAITIATDAVGDSEKRSVALRK